MTTPHQGPPDGAYVYGGGPFRFGQEYSEGAVRQLFSPPTASSPSEAMAIMRDVLQMAPTGTLNGLQNILPGRDEDDFENPDVTVETFMEALEEKENPFSWINDLIDSWVKGVTGDQQSGFTITDLFNVASQQKREQSQMQAAIAQLQADLTANNNSGRTFQVAVSDYSGVPTVFTPAYSLGSGSVTNDGDTLEMSNDDLLVMYRYNLSDLLTDFFEVSLVVPRQSGNFWGSYGDRSLFFVGRANIGWTDLVMARLNGRALSVGCVSGGLDTGTYTWFGSGGSGSGPTVVTINPGSYMTFRGGTVGGDRVFQFLVNNEVVATFVDTGDVSLIGDLYRWTGFGIWNEENDAINRAPNMSHFVANDNQPAPLIGSGARMSRQATSNIGSSSGTHTFPSSFFDFTEYTSEDITVDPSTGKFTVTDAGFYMASARIKCGTSWMTHFTFRLFRNGLADIAFGGDTGFHSTGLGGTVLPDWTYGSVPVYLEAGTELQIGYETDAGTINTFTGEATGFQTWFAIARIPT